MANGFCIVSTSTSSWYADLVQTELLTFPDLYPRGLSEGIRKSIRTKMFADGEMEVEVSQTVRGKDVFLLAGCGRNNKNLSISEQKMEIYHAVDAIKRGAPKKIILVEPYMSCARSDRTTRRNSVGFWIHYKTLTGLGVEHLVTYQLHSDKSKTAVDPTISLIDDIPGSNIIIDYLSQDSHFTQQNPPIFCSVDAGGETLAKYYAKACSGDLIIAHKQRSYEKTNHVEHVRILSDSQLAGKEIWVVDDMIDTAGSLVTLCEELSKREVAKIHAVVIHPVFSTPALERLSKLHQSGLLNRLIVTDTLEITPEIFDYLPFLEVVTTTRRTAEIILRLYDQESLSPFF
jgi:ribose-phosphate pyrophosphokinase